MSETIGTAQIEVTGDARGFDSTVKQAKKSLADLGATASKTGKDTASGMSQAGAATDKLDAATRRAAASIERQALALGKSKAEYYAAKAAIDGNAAALAPYIAKLREAEVNASAVALAQKRMAESSSLTARALGAVAASFSVAKLTQMADAVTTLQNQLKLAVGSTAGAAVAYEALFDIAQRSRVSFTELGGVYASVARAGATLGVSQVRLLKVTESIGNALTISGGSAASMQAALVQLSQGLASGTLRGEELNSVMEQTPRLAKALADGMGVSIGQLREMGAAGLITSEQVVQALESQSAALASEVKNATLSVGQAFTVLQNSATKFVGDADKATGASATLAGALVSVSKGIDSVGKSLSENGTLITTVLGGVAGAGALAGLAAVAGSLGKIRLAVVALSAVLAANPVTLALLGIGAVVGGAVAYNSAASKTVDGMKRTMRELESMNKTGPGIYSRDAEGMKSWEEGVARRNAQIRDLRQQIALLDTQQLDTRAEDARFAASTRNVKANEQLAESMEGIRLRVAGVNKDYTQFYADLAVYQKARESGMVTEQEYVALVSQLSIEYAKGTKAAKSNKDAEKDRWDDIKKRRQEQVDDTNSYLAGLQILAKEEADAAAAVAKAYTASMEKQDAYTATLREQVERQLEQNAAIGLTAEELVKLEVAKLNDAAASKERLASDLAAAGESDRLVQAYRDQAAELRKLAAAKADGGAKQAGADAAEAAREAAKQATEDWKRAAAEIENDITDALMRGFEAGKGFAQNLRDVIVNMFKTLVLRPIIQGVVQGGLSAMGLGAAGAASAGTSAAGSLGSSAVSNLLFGGASMTAMGSSIGTGFMATVSGQSIGAAASAYSAAGMGGVSAGLQIGAAMPYIAAVLVALNALGVFRTTKTVGAGLTGTLGEGDIEGYDLRRKSGTLFGGPDYSTRSTGTSPLSAAIQRDYIALRTGVMDMAEALGLGAERIASFTTVLGANTTVGGGLSGVGVNLNDEYKALQAGKINEQQYAEAVQKKINEALSAASNEMAEQLIGSWTTITEQVKRSITENGAGGYEDVLTSEVTEQVTKSTYVASEYARENERAIDTLTRLAKSLTTVNGIFDVLGTTLYDASLAGGDMASQLADAFGGLDRLTAVANDYYQNFYSEAERTATATRKVSETLADLGYEMPTTREAFRALVDAQDLTTEAGRKTYAALLSVSGGFAAVTAEAAGQLDFVGEFNAARDEYERSMGSVAEATATAAQQARQAADEFERAFAAAGQGIKAFAAQLATEALGGTAEGKRLAAANYATDLALARQGDLKASERITNSAGLYVQEQQANAGSAFEARRAALIVAGQLNALPAAKSYEQQLLEAVQGTTGAVNALGGTLNVELVASARSEILKLIEFVAATDKLPDDLKALALGTTSTMRKTVDYVVGSSLPEDLKNLALTNVSELAKTIKFVGDSTKLPEELKALALKSSDSVSRIINLAVSGLIGDDDKRLALATSSSITKTINAAAGAMDAKALAVAAAQSSTIEKLLKASGGVLTADQRALLDNVTDYNKLVTVSLDTASLNASVAELTKALNVQLTYNFTGEGIASSGEVGSAGGYTYTAITSNGQRYVFESPRAFDAARYGQLNPTLGTYFAANQDAIRAAGQPTNLLDYLTWHFRTYGIREIVDQNDGIDRVYYAKGGAFTNSIVNRPTDFSIGQMGEAGPEAIMPLTRTASGNLGVEVKLPDWTRYGRGDGAAVEALAAEVRALREDNRAQASAMVALQQRMTKLLERWDGQGMPEERSMA